MAMNTFILLKINWLTPGPEWLRKRVSDTLGIDSCEYEPGQGISKHVDNKVLFEEIVVSITLV